MEEKGEINAATYPTESASYPIHPTINPNEAVGGSAYPPAYSQQPTYPPAYPQQPSAYPVDPSAYPKQPMAPSSYPVQPMGAQAFTAVAVVNQPTSSAHSGPPRPPTYLPFTVFNTICCCFLLGLMAKRSGAQVIVEYEKGNYAEAKKASQKALAYNIGALLAGIAVWVVVIVIVVVFVLF